MTEPEIEVQATPRVKDAIIAAAEKLGRKKFSTMSGLDETALESLLDSGEAYVKVAIVSFACQVNKNHGDLEPRRSSVSECLKGAIYRIPGPPTLTKAAPAARRRLTIEDVRAQRTAPLLVDRKSVTILNLSASTISFLILFYFLGGFILGPLFGLPACAGLAPCLGSVVGIALGAVAGLAYISYYFVKKV